MLTTGRGEEGKREPEEIQGRNARLFFKSTDLYDIVDLSKDSLRTMGSGERKGQDSDANTGASLAGGIAWR